MIRRHPPRHPTAGNTEAAANRNRPDLRTSAPAARQPVATESQPQGPSIAEIIPAIIARDQMRQEARASDGWIHASSLAHADFCPRECVLAARHPEMAGTTSVTSAQRLVWALGRAAENHFRASLIEVVGPDRVYARWRCVCGSMQVDGLGHARACDSCGGFLHHNEFKTQFPELAISASPDMLVQDEENRLHVFEIKSAKLDNFRALTAPTGSHVMQARIYAELLERAGLPIASQVTVVYVAKDYTRFGESPYRTFCVPRLRAAAINLQALENSGAPLAMRHPQAPLPARLACCDSAGCRRARSCIAAAACFSTQD